MKPTVTIIIASSRPDICYDRIWGRIRNDGQLSRIILVTQGAANALTLRDPLVHHVPSGSRGRSNALNQAFSLVTTEYVGLTDDDCILAPSWATQAATSLRSPDIAMVFGQTLAYKPRQHPNELCPCTFKKPNHLPKVIHSVTRHFTDVGYDNNVVMRRSLIEAIGPYKRWLGPGSIGRNAEDAEFILRALRAGYGIGYNGNMRVYHDKWLPVRKTGAQARDYLIGGVAAYGYHGYAGSALSGKIAREYIETAPLRDKPFALYGLLLAYSFFRLEKPPQQTI